MEGRWRIEMFGWLRGTLDDLVVSRFRTHNAAVLFAYLALNKDRSYPRDCLGAMLWPEVDEATMRARLRLALTSLRRQFEPPHLPKGSVLQSSGSQLRLNPQMVVTDVEQFEALVASAGKVPDAATKGQLLEQAVGLFRGEFLPGFYEDWILDERQRLNDLLEGALEELSEIYSTQDLPLKSLPHARKLVTLDPWQESRHCRLIELLLDSGNPSAALRQIKEMRTMLAELGEEPSSQARLYEERARQLISTPRRESAKGEEGFAAVTEAVRTLGPQRSKLPVRLTRFFGRKEELHQVLRALEESPGRLVTLTGAGGCGKTRLSVEIGYVMEGQGWNVWFVPLADVGTTSRILDAVLTSLKAERSQNPINDLCRFVTQFAKPLLILDNMEHLIEEGASVVRQILQEADKLTCLVSSRQRLALEGEREVAVHPLVAPATSEITLAQAAALPSVQLYIDRCQALRPDFQLTERNLRPILNLCSQLEGIPLAIEIAASLSQTLSPRQVVEQLDKRFDLLVSSRRDIIERHRTLRNTIAYSYDLLTPLQQRFFASLAVFRGGWTIRSATEICFRPLLTKESAHEDCFSLMLQLRERSLIQTYETSTGEMRFRMLETFRDFGRDVLTPSDLASLTDRFDTYFLQTAEEALRSLRTPGEQASMDAMHGDYDNFVFALERAVDRRDAEYGIRLAFAFCQIWRSRGAVVHERDLMKTLVRMGEEQELSPDLMMKGLNTLSHASYLLCDWTTSLAAEQRTLEIALAESNHEYASISYGGMSNALNGLGRYDECRKMLYKALEHARLAGVEARIPVTLGNLGFTMWREGELAEAESHFREGLALCEKLNQRPQANLHRLNIARVLLDQDRPEEAILELEGSVERAVKMHRAHDAVMALCLFGRYYRLTGEPSRAFAFSQLALEKVFTLMNEYAEMYLAVELGQQLADLGHFEDAAYLLSSLNSRVLSRGDARDVAKTLQRCQAKLPPVTFDRLSARGISTPLTEALKGQIQAGGVAAYAPVA